MNKHALIPKLSRGPSCLLIALPVLALLGAELAPLVGEPAGVEYRNHASLSADLKALAETHAGMVRLTSLATTLERRELWLVEIGTGEESQRRERPAMLLVAGIEGDLVSGASAVRWIQHLVEKYPGDDGIRRLVDSTSLYVVPCANPDAAESFFARPQTERAVNTVPVDDDHDGLVDEDDAEDLNGDGVITAIRVEHPEGDYVADPAEPRLLVKADKAKGERGVWKVLTEGRDNDRDERWNEDGKGGVNFNRNFPYGYQFFAPWAGKHQVSEIETRALADFVIAHPNIGIVFTFGAADNLLKAPKAEPGGKRPPAAISEADAPFYKELGRAFRESLGLKKELESASQPGAFSDWIYFHRGRLSLAARPWTPAQQIASEAASDREKTPNSSEATKEDRPDAKGATDDPESKPDSKSDQRTPKEKPPAADDRGKDERAALKWFDEHAPGRFVAWKPIDHPDFKGRKAEIGGWLPFARSHPPQAVLEDLTRRHAEFLTSLAGRLPRVGIRQAEATPLGNGVFEVVARIENTGYLPTALAQGALTREVLRTRVTLSLEKDRILAGLQKTLLGPIPGSGGMEELRWIVRGTGSLEIEVISALGGTARQTLELEEAL